MSGYGVTLVLWVKRLFLHHKAALRYVPIKFHQGSHVAALGVASRLDCLKEISTCSDEGDHSPYIWNMFRWRERGLHRNLTLSSVPWILCYRVLCPVSVYSYVYVYLRYLFQASCHVYGFISPRFIPPHFPGLNVFSEIPLPEFVLALLRVIFYISGFPIYFKPCFFFLLDYSTIEHITCIYY